MPVSNVPICERCWILRHCAPAEPPSRHFLVRRPVVSLPDRPFATELTTDTCAICRLETISRIWIRLEVPGS